jgi:Fe-Mn family superoxide dismutase
MNRLSNTTRHILGSRSWVSTSAQGTSFPFKLPVLPYAQDALQPHISKETLEFHYGKHHQAYVTNLNTFAEKDPSLKTKSLDEIVMSAPAGPVFNNAAQIWNHTFYWFCMAPGAGGQPKGPLGDAIKRDFGSFDEFKKQFSAVAAGHFGSGWAWLVKDNQGKLKVVQTHDAGHPLREGLGTPILTCDVWEHAYYVDYRNVRAKYIDAWWNVVNWEFASENFSH